MERRSSLIPRIVHQTWKTHDIPERLLPFQKSWRANHPNWEYRFWTDEDNLRLVETTFPEHLDFYRRLPYPILKVDFVKSAYLYRFGGLYVDLDFESLRPMDPLLSGNNVILGRETGGMGYYLRGRDYVLSALMGSTPGHPLWPELLRRFVARFRRKRPWEIYEFYVIQTVIHLLDELVGEYAQAQEDLIVYPHEYFYPNAQLERDLDLRRRSANRMGAYAIHHYDLSWLRLGGRVITAFRFVFSAFYAVTGVFSRGMKAVKSVCFSLAGHRHD
jgi:mannosyltransferase OCH1-like enzyme